MYWCFSSMYVLSMCTRGDLRGQNRVGESPGIGVTDNCEPWTFAGIQIPSQKPETIASPLTCSVIFQPYTKNFEKNKKYIHCLLLVCILSLPCYVVKYKSPYIKGIIFFSPYIKGKKGLTFFHIILEMFITFLLKSLIFQLCNLKFLSDFFNYLCQQL